MKRKKYKWRERQKERTPQGKRHAEERVLGFIR
jgi:hypothetical protein